MIHQFPPFYRLQSFVLLSIHDRSVFEKLFPIMMEEYYALFQEALLNVGNLKLTRSNDQKMIWNNQAMMDIDFNLFNRYYPYIVK